MIHSQSSPFGTKMRQGRPVWQQSCLHLERSLRSANAGVRGTNAQKYGYGGNTIDQKARAFGGLA